MMDQIARMKIAYKWDRSWGEVRAILNGTTPTQLFIRCAALAAWSTIRSVVKAIGDYERIDRELRR